MGKSSVLAILMLLMSSCAKTVEVVVKNEAGMPYIGAQVYVFSEDIPEIEKCVMLDAQWRQQNELEERFVFAGLSYKEAKTKAKEQYLVVKYGVSPVWLLTGKGAMFST